MLDVDLSTVPVDDPFYVLSVVEAEAVTRERRESAASAYVRDPAQTGGTQVVTTGLELTAEPLPPPPADLLARPEPCPNGPNPASAAGNIEFDAPAYEMAEGHVFGADDIHLVRTGGSRGLVSATVSTGGGSATPGAHYEPLELAIRFADGDTSPRTVPLEILSDDQAESDRTIELSLSAPGGCAALGARSSAVLTIRDDDQVVEASQRFTVGGTVEGLIGTGLVLDNNHGPFLEIFGNGPFTFTDLPLPSGSPYSVNVFNRPRNPSQDCTVSNGSGTFTDHDVTDVLVSCV